MCAFVNSTIIQPVPRPWNSIRSFDPNFGNAPLESSVRERQVKFGRDQMCCPLRESWLYSTQFPWIHRTPNDGNSVQSWSGWRVVGMWSACGLYVIDMYVRIFSSFLSSDLFFSWLVVHSYLKIFATQLSANQNQSQSLTHRNKRRRKKSRVKRKRKKARMTKMNKINLHLKNRRSPMTWTLTRWLCPSGSSLEGSSWITVFCMNYSFLYELQFSVWITVFCMTFWHDVVQGKMCCYQQDDPSDYLLQEKIITLWKGKMLANIMTNSSNIVPVRYPKPIFIGQSSRLAQNAKSRSITMFLICTCWVVGGIPSDFLVLVFYYLLIVCCLHNYLWLQYYVLRCVSRSLQQ